MYDKVFSVSYFLWARKTLKWAKNRALCCSDVNWKSLTRLSWTRKYPLITRILNQIRILHRTKETEMEVMFCYTSVFFYKFILHPSTDVCPFHLACSKFIDIWWLSIKECSTFLQYFTFDHLHVVLLKQTPFVEA